jgi:hypothetical protein
MRVVVILTLCCIALAAGVAWFVLRQPVEPPADSAALSTREAKLRMAIPPEKIIDYGKIKENSDKALADLMEERKQSYGVEQSIDMIVKSDESIKVGNETVPMKKILDQVRLEQGEILETDLKKGSEKQKTEDYGIYVVQENDNIWDIHFKLLKDYYAHKGIHISPLADEPDSRGLSSGVGKILKFSEHMVYIFNLKEHKLETDLNQIYPLTKIVAYNMTFIFALLDRVNYDDVDRIEFDGETLWLPAEL